MWKTRLVPEVIDSNQLYLAYQQIIRTRPDGATFNDGDIFDHAVYNPRDGKKTVLYQYDGGYFSAPELYSEDYRFYQSIEYDKERDRLIASATGTAFHLGDRVRVRAARVNIPLGEINFDLLPPEEAEQEAEQAAN